MKKTIIIFSVLALTTSVFSQQESDYLLKYDNDSCLCFGYKNRKGEIVIPAQYNYATDTLRTIATAIDTVWRLYMIDRNGKEIEGLIPFCYADFTPDNELPSEGLFRFIENGKMGFADLTGKKIITAQFDFVAPFREGLAVYFMGGGWTPVDGSTEFQQWTGEYERGYINHAGERVNLPQPTETQWKKH